MPQAVQTDANHDLLVKSLTDVQEFYGKDLVTVGELWQRYNHCAEYSDSADRLADREFRELLSYVDAKGKISVDIFGVTDPDD